MTVHADLLLRGKDMASAMAAGMGARLVECGSC